MACSGSHFLSYQRLKSFLLAFFCASFSVSLLSHSCGFLSHPFFMIFIISAFLYPLLDSQASLFSWLFSGTKCFCNLKNEWKAFKRIFTAPESIKMSINWLFFVILHLACLLNGWFHEKRWLWADLPKSSWKSFYRNWPFQFRYGFFRLKNLWLYGYVSCFHLES